MKFQEIQQLNVFWKKVFIVLVLCLISIPLVIFTGTNFKKKADRNTVNDLWKDVDFNKIEESFQELEGIKQEFDSYLASSTTSTYDKTTTTTE